MFSHDHYVPILKGKAGEFDGIGHLTAATKDRFTPLIEIPPIDWNFDTDTDAKSIDEHIADLPKKISNCWENHRVFFVDAKEIAAYAQTQAGPHPLEVVFDGLRSRSMQAVPVTTLGRPQAFQMAVASIVRADQRGACLRIGSTNLVDVAQLQSALNQLLSILNLSPNSVDLIVDFGEINDAQLPTMQLVVNAILPQIPYLTLWRSLSLASTGMPPDLAGVSTNTTVRATRTEWLLWQRFQQHAPVSMRVPTFADYGITHPSYPQLDFRLIKIGAKIKYTADSYWLLVKGASLGRAGHGQYRSLAAHVLAQPEYCGSVFSWGDQYIYDCANNNVGPGTPRTWMAVGTNHHITFVVNQLANTRAPSSTPVR